MSRRTTVVVGSALVVVLAVVGAVLLVPGPDPVPHTAIGVTHTEHSAVADNPEPAVERALDILGNVTEYGNQHIMGWGANNPSPRPGERDWASLDARVQLLDAAGTTPVITLCCAPDWMKGGEPGETDWSRLEVAPDPAYFDDFTQLAVDVARRYPQVKHFVVWNEMKGFFDEERNRWDAEAYTTLYNMVYRSLKEVDPGIQVGGPYVVMDSWSSIDAIGTPSALAGPWGVVDQRSLDAVDYWLRHNAGADFVAVDGSSATKDAGLVAPPPVANRKFAAVTEWLRSRTTLPVWWMEIYPEVEDAEADDWTSPYRADVALDALLTLSNAGAAVVLIWQPEGDDAFETVALWSPTRDASGGQPQPLVARLETVREAWDDGYLVAPRWVDGALVLDRHRPEPPS